MRSHLVVLATLALVVLATCDKAADKRLSEEQNEMSVQIADSRLKAHEAAEAWEKHIQQLDAEVLPDDHFSHDPAKKPAAKKPATKRPAAKRPAAKRPAAKRPAAKRPVAKRPVAAVQSGFKKHAAHKVVQMKNSASQWHVQTAEQVRTSRSVLFL